MRKRLTLVLALAVLALGVVSAPTHAQRTSGSISGVVKDPGGAVVPGASVTVVNADTGFVREVKSNDVGAYTAADLPVGTYALTVEVEGFRTLVVENIVVNVASDRTIDCQLEAGELEEAVTVTESAVVVETVSGEVAGLITGEQVRELPLNGRNFLQLTQLMPGVTTLDNFNTKNKGLLTGSDVSVSGGRVTSNMWMVDGTSNNDIGSNRTILVYPSLEAVEEFKIHRNSYGAEFGGAGGAQINLVTRSGTNQFQGSAYYFGRDDSWNEPNYILEQQGEDAEPLSRDDYGYTFGGAIKKDRLHFFVSQEWNDETRGIVRSGLVPTAAEKQGDFSQSNPACSPRPIDPLTGQPFPGNRIPANRLDQGGQLYMDLYPDANTTTSSCINWIDSIDVPIDWEQINARVDWDITSEIHAMVRYTEDDWEDPGPTAGDANGLWGDDPFPRVDSSWVQPSHSFIAQLNTVIGTSALNTIAFSQAGNEILIGQTGDLSLMNELLGATPPTLGPKTANPRAHPVFWGGGGLQALWNAGQWDNKQDLLIIKDDFEKVFGDHQMKVGVLYSENQKAEVANGAAAGEATSYWGGAPGSGAGVGGWGGNTGNTIADFLLEDMTFGFSERSHNTDADSRWEDLEIYVADTWRVSPTVTLDVGLRYSDFPWPYDKNSNLLLNFNPERFNPALGNAACNGLMQVPGTDPCGAAGIAGASTGPNKSLINDSTNIAPRVGVAWDISGDGSSVIRAGFGQFFQRERVSPNLGLTNNPPGVGFTAGIRDLDGENQFLDFTGSGRPQSGFDINADTPYNLQYNVSWEQRLTRDSTLELSYVGSRGYDLLRSNDINQVPAGDPNGNGIPDRIEFVRCDGANAACRAPLRRFGAFGDVDIVYWTTDGESEYNSLQTQYTLRFGRGSQVQASYTFADFKSDADVSDSNGGFNENGTTTDLADNLDWAPASLHRDHVFNASAIWNLPTYSGEGGFKEWVLGNWSVGGIVIYATGSPLNVLGANPGGELGGTAVTAIGYDNNARPRRTSASCSGGPGGQLRVLNPGGYTFTGMVLGDTSTQGGKFNCEGPDFFQVDLSLYKQIPIGDRFNVQLRFEAFNVFNEVNVIAQSVDRQFNAPVTLNAPRAQATHVVSTGQPSPTFGLATRVRDPRQFQLGIKFSF
jgi:hypothetical protein